MNNKNTLEICEKIKFILFPYFSSDFEKIFVNLTLTDYGYSSRSYKVLLKNGKIRCISNYHSIPKNKCDYILDLFKQLKEQMKEEFGAWQNCFFYVTKDNKYEIDFIFNPNAMIL